MEKQIEDAKRRLEKLPIFSGTAILLLLLLGLVITENVSTWSYIGILVTWMLGVVFATKFVVVVLFEDKKQNEVDNGQISKS